jgi:hypothetical protein
MFTYLKSKMKPPNKNIQRSSEQNEMIKITGKVIIGDLEYPWDIEVSPRPIEKNKEFLLDDVAEEKLINEIRNLYRSVTK